MLPEVLRDRYRIRDPGAEVGGEIPHLRCVWPQSRHERGPRGIAHRQLAVGALKKHTRIREPIQVWRQHFLHPIATQIAAHVINRDEQHVGFALGGLKRADERLNRCDENEAFRFHGDGWGHSLDANHAWLVGDWLEWN